MGRIKTMRNQIIILLLALTAIQALGAKRRVLANSLVAGAKAALAKPAVAAKATPAVAKCSDREPPKDQEWKFPTCALQLSKIPENCAKRRSGALKDGFCSKTCGVCGAKKTGKAAGKKTGKAAGKKTGKAA